MGVWQVLALACIIKITYTFSEPVRIKNSSYALNNEYPIYEPHTDSDSNCVCFPNKPKGKLVPNKLIPNGGPLERLVVYLYRDKSTDKLWIFTPNRDLQSVFPDLSYDDEDLAPYDKHNVLDLLRIYLGKIIPKDILRSDTLSAVEPEIYKTQDTAHNVKSPESLSIDSSDQELEPSYNDTEASNEENSDLENADYPIQDNDNPKKYDLSYKPIDVNNSFSALINTSSLPTEHTSDLFLENSPQAIYNGSFQNKPDSQYDLIKKFSLDQSVQFPLNEMMNLQNYFMFSGIDAKLIRDQLIHILKANHINWSLKDLLTNPESMPKLSLVPVLTQDIEKYQHVSKKGSLNTNKNSWQLLILLVNQSETPKILGNIYLGKTKLPQRFNFLASCHNCELISSCKSKKCYRNITHINKKLNGRHTMKNNNHGNYIGDAGIKYNEEMQQSELPISDIGNSKEDLAGIQLDHNNQALQNLLNNKDLNSHLKYNLANLESEVSLPDTNDKNKKPLWPSTDYQDVDDVYVSDKIKHREQELYQSLSPPDLKELSPTNRNVGHFGHFKHYKPVMKSKYQRNKYSRKKHFRNKIKNKPLDIDVTRIRDILNYLSKNKHGALDKKNTRGVNKLLKQYLLRLTAKQPISNYNVDDLGGEFNRPLKNYHHHRNRKNLVSYWYPNRYRVIKNLYRPKYESPITFTSGFVRNPTYRNGDDNIESSIPTAINTLDEKDQDEELFNGDHISNDELDVDGNQEENIPIKSTPEMELNIPVEDNLDGSSGESAFDEDDLGTRILGGNAATSSGTPVESRGRSGN